MESKTTNGRYLDSISHFRKFDILNNIASHYEITIQEAETEVLDYHASNLYEYISNDNALRNEVYREFNIVNLATQ